MSQFRVIYQAEEPETTVRERWEVTCGLCDAGAQMMWENLRRRHPDANQRELTEIFDRWLQHRPGALAGDGPQPD